MEVSLKYVFWKDPAHELLLSGGLDSTQALDFSADGNTLYVLDTRGRDSGVFAFGQLPMTPIDRAYLSTQIGYSTTP